MVECFGIESRGLIKSGDAREVSEIRPELTCTPLSAPVANVNFWAAEAAAGACFWYWWSWLPLGLNSWGFRDMTSVRIGESTVDLNKGC